MRWRTLCPDLVEVAPSEDQRKVRHAGEVEDALQRARDEMQIVMACWLPAKLDRRSLQGKLGRCSPPAQVEKRSQPVQKLLQRVHQQLRLSSQPLE